MKAPRRVTAGRRQIAVCSVAVALLVFFASPLRERLGALWHRDIQRNDRRVGRLDARALDVRHYLQQIPASNIIADQDST